MENVVAKIVLYQEMQKLYHLVNIFMNFILSNNMMLMANMQNNILDTWKVKLIKMDFVLPCCFRTPPSDPKRLRIKNQCEINKDDNKVPATSNKKVQPGGILSNESFPIDQGRIGYLPYNVESFFNYNHSDYFIKGTNKLRINTKHMLRIGVENSTNQSFIGCIAMAYSIIFNQELETINLFKKRIINHITLDNFLTFQNGNLVDIFYDDNANLSLIKVDKFKSTQLYKSLYKNNEYYLKKIIYSYQAFISYIEDDKSIIDYRYLWDIVTNYNGLFKDIVKLTKYKSNNQIAGLNLIILNIMDNDNTSNINFVCPTSLYSSDKFNNKKRTLILIKSNDNYEPIIGYKNTQNSTEKTITFSQFDTSVDNKNYRETAAKIKTLMNACNPEKSIPHLYKLEKNINLRELLNKIKEINLKTKVPRLFIKSYVLNYNNKVVGIQIYDIRNEKTRKNVIFVPCYASSLVEIQNLEKDEEDDVEIKKIDLITLDELKPKSYDITIKELLDNVKIFPTIKTKPIMKVVDKAEQIVGIITEADQFIRVIPQGNVEDNLETKYSYDYNSLDKKIMKNNKGDEERITKIKNLKMESLYYNLFRSTFKKLINKYDRENDKEQILFLLNRKITLQEKVNEMLKVIEKILSDVVEFTIHDKETISEIYK